MHALILAGGELELSSDVIHIAKAANFIIAADSGIRHAQNLHLKPNLIVGDFDSASETDLSAFKDIPKKGFSTDKDWLDLEIALDEVLKLEPSKISVLGATGGRIDQTLAAILIASAHTARNISLHSGKQSIFFMQDEASMTLELAPNTLFSLLSLKDDAVMSVKNARYELEQFRLAYGVGLGVSNRVSQSPLQLDLSNGLIAIIVEHYE
jgi:thiamine pyrophosphokinase